MHDLLQASVDPAVATTGAHEYAVVELPSAPQTYGGISTRMSVNDPTIQDPNQEFSLSQVWVVAGSYSDSSINTAEVGWQVYPATHPNDNSLAPHLFIYWTSDAYRTTGCYNLGCSGFVQTDNSWVFGGTFTNYTTLAANANYETEFEVINHPPHILFNLLLTQSCLSERKCKLGTLSNSNSGAFWVNSCPPITPNFSVHFQLGNC